MFLVPSCVIPCCGLWQRGPVHWAVQEHVNPFTPSVQVPPLRQGLLVHSLMFWSQFTPCQPELQMQMYPGVEVVDYSGKGKFRYDIIKSLSVGIKFNPNPNTELILLSFSFQKSKVTCRCQSSTHSPHIVRGHRGYWSDRCYWFGCNHLVHNHCLHSLQDTCILACLNLGIVRGKKDWHNFLMSCLRLKDLVRWI